MPSAIKFSVVFNHSQSKNVGFKKSDFNLRYMQGEHCRK